MYFMSMGWICSETTASKTSKDHRLKTIALK